MPDYQLLLMKLSVIFLICGLPLAAAWVAAETAYTSWRKVPLVLLCLCGIGLFITLLMAIWNA